MAFQPSAHPDQDPLDPSELRECDVIHRFQLQGTLSIGNRVAGLLSSAAALATEAMVALQIVGQRKQVVCYLVEDGEYSLVANPTPTGEWGVHLCASAENLSSEIQTTEELLFLLVALVNEAQHGCSRLGQSLGALLQRCPGLLARVQCAGAGASL